MKKWVRMPSRWINSNKLTHFTSHKNVSSKIAAIKLFIVFCLRMERGKDGFYSCSVTYDQLVELTSLSRASIKKGIDFLELQGLICVRGDRKKIYLINNVGVSGWCKVPVGVLMSNDDEIEPFKLFCDRYSYELNALKLYLYLLAIRGNEESFSDVSVGKIVSKTGIKTGELARAVGFMQTLGLISHVEEIVGEAPRTRPEFVRMRFFIGKGGELVRGKDARWG